MLEEITAEDALRLSLASNRSPNTETVGIILGMYFRLIRIASRAGLRSLEHEPYEGITQRQIDVGAALERLEELGYKVTDMRVSW